MSERQLDGMSSNENSTSPTINVTPCDDSEQNNAENNLVGDNNLPCDTVGVSDGSGTSTARTLIPEEVWNKRIQD